MGGERIGVIILAAGSSSRMGGVKKEFYKFKNGETALELSVRSFLKIRSVSFIIIAVNEGAQISAKESLPDEFFSDQNSKIHFVTGGSSRRASVFNALLFINSFNPDYVLIHDGARPWISAELAENLIAAVIKYNAVIPFLPVTETPKEFLVSSVECGVSSVECRVSSEECGEKGVVFVERHLKRANVGLAQTPQAFKFPEILHAHKKAAEISDEEFTDDAEIWGRFNGKVAAISGEIENKKITFQEDLL